MPWVDEWFISGKDAQGNNIWSNRQYYVAPPSGQAGGEDYKNTVYVQTLSDANTGAPVVSIQNATYDNPSNTYEVAKTVTNALEAVKTVEAQGGTAEIKQNPDGAGYIVEGQIPREVTVEPEQQAINLVPYPTAEEQAQAIRLAGEQANPELQNGANPPAGWLSSLSTGGATMGGAPVGYGDSYWHDIQNQNANVGGQGQLTSQELPDVTETWTTPLGEVKIRQRPDEPSLTDEELNGTINLWLYEKEANRVRAEQAETNKQTKRVIDITKQNISIIQTVPSDVVFTSSDGAKTITQSEVLKDYESV